MGCAAGYRETFSKVLVSVIDITERKRSEEALRESEKKLIHANKMTALGTLVSGIAHEINNPNSFILTNADLLSDIWNEEAGEIIAKHYLKNTKISPVRPSLRRLVLLNPAGVWYEGCEQVALAFDVHSTQDTAGCSNVFGSGSHGSSGRFSAQSTTSFAVEESSTLFGQFVARNS